MSLIILSLPGWYLITLGFWSMLYTPIHFAVFLIISALLPVLLYTAYTLHGLYLALGEAYIDVSIVISCHVMAHLVMKSCCIAVRALAGAGEGLVLLRS